MYPLGEDTSEVIEERKFKKKLTNDDIQWLIKNYKYILSIDDSISSISNYEIFKKRSGGVNTSHYDFLSNSSGQDNLMQIMYLLLSFIKLKTEYDNIGEPWPGGILLIDELDAKLHPKLLRYVISLFKNRNVNKKGAQLLFTSHDMTTMKNTVFRRDEIWLAAENERHESEIYSLYEIRRENNERVNSTAAYDKKYLEGRYGADPYLTNMLAGGEWQ